MLLQSGGSQKNTDHSLYDTFFITSNSERDATERKELKSTSNPADAEKLANVKAMYSQGDFSGMDIKQQNAIRLKMQEKDDVIIELKADNTQTKAALNNLRTEHSEMKTK